MPNKPQYVDFQSITRGNFEAVLKQYEKLVYKWLSKTKSPKQHWKDMQRQFWEQVWVDHRKFDRKKGRLSTWLGWRWLSFYSHMARDAKKIGHLVERELTMGDGKYLNRQQPVTTNWGLDPTQQHVEGQDIDKPGAFEELPAVHEPEYESPEAELALRQLLTQLSDRDQELIEWLELGYTNGEIATLAGISTSAVSARTERMRKRVEALLKERPATKAYSPRYAFTNNVFWHEFFKTLRDTTPYEGNDYSHAAEIRTRNKWRH